MICGPELARIVSEFEESMPFVEDQKLFIYITNKPKASKINSPNMSYL